MEILNNDARSKFDQQDFDSIVRYPYFFDVGISHGEHKYACKEHKLFDFIHSLMVDVIKLNRMRADKAYFKCLLKSANIDIVPHKFRIKFFADLNIDNHPILVKDRKRLTKHMLRVHFLRLSRSIRNLQSQLHDAWYSFHNTFLHEMFIKNIVYCMNIIASSVMMHKFHTHHDKFNRLVEYLSLIHI